MRLVTNFVFPDEVLANKRAIGRGERAKAERETVSRDELPGEVCGAVGPREQMCRLEYNHKGDHSWRRQGT